VLTEPVIKVCGIRDQAVFAAAIEAGATAIGINFVERSRRRIGRRRAIELLSWARDTYDELPQIVGVFADEVPSRITALRDRLSLDAVQLHGNEPDLLIDELAPAFKAVPLSKREELADIASTPGSLVLVDAKVGDQFGGTGQLISIALLVEACRIRRVVVAGGLNATNVAEVIAATHPAGVDTASGIENDDGTPSAEAAFEFIAAARRAFEEIATGT
jgi:phosphoribosylanthranilate isomerase